MYVMVLVLFYLYVTTKEAYSFSSKKFMTTTSLLKDQNELCNGHESFQHINSPNFNYEYADSDVVYHLIHCTNCLFFRY